MIERGAKGQKETSPFENPLIIGHFPDGGPITAGALAQLFSKRSPQQQEKYAYTCFLKYKTEPALVLSWITEEETRDKVKLWCIGRGMEVKEPARENAEIDPILSKDAELIKKLGPYLRQADLARLVTLRRYRESDPNTQHALVCGVYRLLGEYLGPRRYFLRESENPRLLSLPDLAPEIFADNLTREILIESEREALLPIFNKDVDEGFRYLQELKSQTAEPLYHEFIVELQNHFQKAKNLSLNGFKAKIPGSQKDIEDQGEIAYSPYPSFHQREFAYRFINKKNGKVDLLIGATRTMKSGAAQYAMKAAGAESPVIICPSGINKLNWTRELQEKLEEDVEILTIDSLDQLRTLAANGPTIKPSYTIIGYQLLSRLNLEESSVLFQKLKTQLGWDSLIADEIHLAKEPEAECTQQLYMLSRQLPENAPRIAMTATGIVNLVEDLDAPVRILLPYRYPNRGDFTKAARNDPYLVSALLHGEQLMTRWAKEAILGDKLPPIEYHEQAVPLSPFHQRIYEYVYFDDTIESQVKRGMLRQVSLEPLLIRRHYHPQRILEMISRLQDRLDDRQDDREREILNERIRAFEERLFEVSNLTTETDTIKDLHAAHQKFLEWKSTHNPNEKFDEDFLVKLGYDRLALWAFFNLSAGVDKLVRDSRNTALQADWQGKQEIFSSKYHALRKKVDEDLHQGKKVIVFSGFYQTQVTSGIEDVTEDDDLAFLSLYDHLRSWYGDDSVLKIDGAVSIEPRAGELAERERIRRAWRLRPEKKILLATLRSSRLGIDLSIPPIKANRDITALSENFIDFPDTYADVDQGIGRGWGPGQKIPVEVTFFKATNAEKPNTFRYGFIDHGMWEAIEFKRLLSQMVLDGVPLTKEEEKKVNAHLSSVRIELYPQTPRNHLFIDFLNKVRGQGAKKNLEFLKGKGFEDMSNVDFFATYYPENDQLSAAGHNARAVSEIIKKINENSSEPKIASVGAGAGILEATLSQPVVNIDILPEILQVAKIRNSQAGEYIIGEAANLPVNSGIFDITEASFMLHWSDNQKIRNDNGTLQSERALILEELNRVTKTHGTVIITLPVSHLNKERFLTWLDSLEKHFGFKRRLDIPSGLLRATDYRTEQVSWIFILEKIDNPQKGYNLDNLSFEFEEITRILDKSRATTGDRDITTHPIPHLEFEILEQSGGKSHKIQLKIPEDHKKLEEFLLSPDSIPYSDDLSILSSFGTEEFGFYRRLLGEARSKFGLTIEGARELAMETLLAWERDSSYQKHDAYRIWSGLKGLMEEIQERRRLKS